MITLHFNDKTLNVQENDSSYRYRSLMAKPILVLKFSLSEYVEIPVGAWCEYMGQTYTLRTPQNFKKQGTRNIEYTLTMGSDEDILGLYKFRNTVDGRLKWSMCAKPIEFLTAIVDCLNARDSGWSVGTCIDAAERTLEFNHAYIDEALQNVSDEFETEWEISGKVVSLGKVEYFKENPLALAYGRGNGFMPGVGRSTLSDEMPVKRVYVQGGEKNIDRSIYGSPTLLLPKGQSLEYEGRTYGTDSEGLYIERTDVVSDAVKEDSLDCSDIYPQRVGSVSSVDVVDEGKNLYDFTDNSIPDNLDFNDCLIGGETPYIRFQSGMLAGEKDFEFKYIHADEEGNAVRRFELVPQEIDGQIMPNATFKPQEGDAYAVFGIMLPSSYICDNDSKSGASWDMFREGARFLYEHEDQKFTFAGELQGLWAKRNWVNVGGKIVVGGYVKFTDAQFATEGVLIRITGVKDYLTSPYSPTVELSNSVSGKGISSALRDIENAEVKIDEAKKETIRFTKRRFRDAQETMLMLEDALLNFSGSINPITVQTMAALVGDESLQFRFVESKESLKQVSFAITYDNEAKQLHCPAGFLQHMTLGINTVKAEHEASEYKVWEMAEYTSAVLDNPKAKYYLYAKVSRTSTDEKGVFLLSETAIDMNAVEGFYHLLTGVLNSEYEGERSYVDLYGFTEILPGRITTDKIVSTDGETYFDLVGGEIGGKINFKKGSKGLKELEEWTEVDKLLTTIQDDIKNNNKAVTDLNKYVDGAFADGIITKAEAQAINTYINNVNNSKAAVDSTYRKLYANALLPEDEKTALETAKASVDDAVTALIGSITTAIEDEKATAEESADVDAKYAAYTEAYETFYEAVEAANESIQGVLKGYSDEAMKKANEADKAIQDLNKYVDGAFSDGIITKAEAEAIATYINTINNTKEAALAEYEKLSESGYLGEDEKTALDEAKAALVDAIDSLISSIETAIEDGKATADESADVDAKFEAYNTAMADYKSAVGDAHNSINATIYAKAAEAMKAIGEFSYLKEALQQETTIAGGLILSSFIALGRSVNGVFSAKSGLNGIYDSSKKGGGIAAWYGGAAVDKDDNPNGLTPAVSLVRFDGSGYYANGAITWDAGGNLSMEGDVYASTLSVEPPTGYTLPEIKGRYGMFYMDFAPCNSRSVVSKTYKASGDDGIVTVSDAADFVSGNELTITNNDAVIFFSSQHEYSGEDIWVAIVIPYTVYKGMEISGYCDSALSETSEHPVKNWVITQELKRRIQNVSSLPTNPEDDVLYILT